MLWQGKELKEYSKEELMLIIETLARAMREQQLRHSKDLENLLG